MIMMMKMYLQLICDCFWALYCHNCAFFLFLVTENKRIYNYLQLSLVNENNLTFCSFFQPAWGWWRRPMRTCWLRWANPTQTPISPRYAKQSYLPKKNFFKIFLSFFFFFGILRFIHHHLKISILKIFPHFLSFFFFWLWGYSTS